VSGLDVAAAFVPDTPSACGVIVGDWPSDDLCAGCQDAVKDLAA
jgi:hypothetical protein